jgi:hypothetical protein
LAIWGRTALIIVFTLLSGIGDSQGFLHAAQVWKNDAFVGSEALRSALGYTFGSVMYWMAIRFLNQVRAVSPEIQTLGWFAVTILGIGIASGRFRTWQTLDKAVAVVALTCVAWLVVRTGA